MARTRPLAADDTETPEGRHIEYVRVKDLVPAKKNPKQHSISDLSASVGRFGFTNPIIVDDRTGRMVAGHGRVTALQTMRANHQDAPDGILVDQADGEWLIPVLRGWGSKSDAEADALLIADNKQAELGGWDDGALAEMLRNLTDHTGIGFGQDELADLLRQLDPDDERGGGSGKTAVTLSDRFVIPPFTILDTRQGYWQDRKREWQAYGIQSELGRGENLTYGDSAVMNEPGLNFYRDKEKNKHGMMEPVEGDAVASPTKEGFARAFAQDLMRGETKNGKSKGKAGSRLAADQGSNITGAPPLPEWANNGLANMAPGTSIFDPVLCEVAYRWFSPHGGTVLDPFAGGSVRGIVAALLGRHYVGMDLRADQVEANRRQANQICRDVAPVWHTGDSRTITTAAPGEYDFVFSCPPYADLERYSDDPLDLSTMKYADFVTAYREIIAAAVAMLRPDRFACFVVGDVRDKRGIYRNFVSDTISAFQDAGAMLYNEAILVNQVGSSALRASKQFVSGRKLVKTHQNVLIFLKGDAKRATEACGPVTVILPDANKMETDFDEVDA